MKPRFVGHVNFARMNPSKPELWQLEEPFAQVTRDGYLAIARPWKYINGASIPRFLWFVLGHPFDNKNKFWSVVHDEGYTDDALVIRLADLHDIPPDTLLQRRDDGGWVYELFEDFHTRRPRPWFDRVMVEAMDICEEPCTKMAACWSGVRIGGWKAWNKHRGK